MTVQASDRDTLHAIYESMGGYQWIHSDGWLSEAPLDEWHGVEISQGNVVGLRLAGNNLRGVLSDSFTKLKQLDYLDLRWNAISGKIPPSIGDLSELRTLLLSSNELSGSIPENIGLLTKLERVDLSYNDLSGGIPSDLGNLGSLRSIGLHHNRLSGRIPSSLGEIKSLKRLILNNNELYGLIPASFHELDHLQIQDNLFRDSDAHIWQRSNSNTNRSNSIALYGIDVMNQTTFVFDDEEIKRYIEDFMRSIEVRGGYLYLHESELPEMFNIQESRDVIEEVNLMLRQNGETVESIDDLERVLELAPAELMVVPENNGIEEFYLEVQTRQHF